MALGADAPAGELSRDAAQALAIAYGVGLDLTRRDLQGAAKAKGLPWDTGKAFDHSAPISEIVPVAQVTGLESRALLLQVIGQPRQLRRLARAIGPFHSHKQPLVHPSSTTCIVSNRPSCGPDK